METAQEVYDKIVTHLRTQGKKAIYHGACRYRFFNLKCAIGCLLTDEEYDDRMEGGDIYDLINGDYTPQRVYNLLNDHYDLCKEMQNIHDGDLVEEWEQSFKTAALRFNLVYTPPVNS